MRRFRATHDGGSEEQPEGRWTGRWTTADCDTAQASGQANEQSAGVHVIAETIKERRSR